MAYKKIRLDDIERIDYVDFKKRVTIKQILKNYQPDFVLNGTLYDVKSGATIVNSVDENKPTGYLFSQQGIAIKDRRTLLYTTKKEAVEDETIFDFIGGSPTLVKDGKVHIDAGGTNSWILSSSSYRSFLGFNKDHLFLGSSDHTNTIKSLANYCVSQGMQYAINLDGGGSCTLAETTGGKIKYLVNRETRPNANWVLVYLKKKGSDTVSDNKKVVKPQKVVGNSKITLEGVNIEGRAYAPIREFEKLGCKVSYVDGVAYIDLPK